MTSTKSACEYWYLKWSSRGELIGWCLSPSPSSSSLASQGQDIAGVASVSDEAEANSPPSVSRGCVLHLLAAALSSFSTLRLCFPSSLPPLPSSQEERLLMIMSNLDYMVTQVVPRLFDCFVSYGYPPCLYLQEVENCPLPCTPTNVYPTHTHTHSQS